MKVDVGVPMHNLLLFGALVHAQPIAPPTPAPGGAYHPSRSFAPLVEAIQPAVVTIEVESGSDLGEVPPHVLEMFGFNPRDLPHPSGEGSGFVISEDGLLLTNHHVIADADQITVTLQDGRRIEAEVVGSDASIDIALLRLEGRDRWPHVTLADSEAVQVGDWVLSMGNALGLGTTATFGIVSGKGRVLGHDVLGREDFIQTDAAINQGNSGGPLFDLHGRVIGMNTAIIAGANTVGFAIPSNLILSVLQDLERNGRVARGFLGVQPQTLSEELRESLEVRAAKGVVIANVTDDTPAQEYGLQTGDVVLGVDGEAIESDTDLIRAISAKRPGDQVELQIERNRKTKDLRVILAERPGPLDATPPPVPATADRAGRTESLGLSLSDLPSALAEEAGVRKGVLVDGVTRGSAADGRLKAGDVLVEVNRRPVSEPEDVERILARSVGSALLLVVRDQTQEFVALPLP